MSRDFPIADRSRRRAETLRERVDYAFLRIFATDRNKATEAELDAQAARSTFTIEDARAYLEKVRSVYFDGKLPVVEQLYQHSSHQFVTGGLQFGLRQLPQARGKVGQFRPDQAGRLRGGE